MGKTVNVHIKNKNKTKEIYSAVLFLFYIVKIS